MANEEKRNNENKFTEKCCDTSCCGGQSTSEAMAECMKKCRWFPLIPVTIGVLFLLLGYYLNAEVTRVLWIAAAGLAVLAGTFGFIMMSIGGRICCGSE